MAEKDSQRGRPRFGSPPKEKTVTIGIAMLPSLVERLDKYCEEDERSRSWAVTKAVSSWLEGKGY